MYAETVTPSMRRAIDETARRRRKQMAYNRKHGIIPRTIVKPVHGVIAATTVAEDADEYAVENLVMLDPERRRKMIRELRKKMKKASRELAFEEAAELRDLIFELERAPVSTIETG